MQQSPPSDQIAWLARLATVSRLLTAAILGVRAGERVHLQGVHWLVVKAKQPSPASVLAAGRERSRMYPFLEHAVFVFDSLHPLDAAFEF